MRLAASLVLLASILLPCAFAHADEVRSPSPSPEDDYSVTFRIGQDVTYAPAADGAPLLGNLELSLTTENLPLAYLTLRSWHGGLGTTELLEQAGMGGKRGLTQACYICLNLGWNLKTLTPENAGFLGPGHLTLGVQMEDVWVGTELAYMATSFGGEIGYMTRRGPFFAHLVVGIAEILDHGDPRGERIKMEIAGFWRGLGPIALYGRLGMAQGSMDYDEFSFDFGGPIMSVGLAYVTR